MISSMDLLLRLGVALLLGALIGLERESKDQDAGLRTNALVSLGTALFTIISAYAFLHLASLPHVQFDPARIASYVVAGIGFLGGGAIFIRRDSQKVKGLTTAAAIWAVAAIGMACGAGMLLEAVIATLLVLFVLIGLRYVEVLIWPYNSSHTHTMRITTAPDAPGELIGHIYDAFENSEVFIEQITIVRQEVDGIHENEIFTIGCRASKREDFQRAMSSVRQLKGVQTVHSQLRRVRVSDG